MTDEPGALRGKVALVSGASRRVGAAIVRALHGEGMSIALHFHRSAGPAEALRADLEAVRPESIRLFRADLTDGPSIPRLVAAAAGAWGRLDGLVNNASTFFPTPVGSVSEADWDNLIGTNLKAPFFLAQAAAPHLAAVRGAIVNIADIHGQRPLAGHPVYSVAKAGLIMLTRTLARELGPDIRVNAIAPGPILWSARGLDDEAKDQIVARTALGRTGTPEEIAQTVTFLIRDAGYITGQTIAVDGGRSLD